MRQSAFHILRVGVAITFLWIGVLILKDTQSFSALLDPWALNLLGYFTNNLDSFLHSMMVDVAIADLVVGFFLLINRFVFLAAGVGFLHLLSVIITSAILVTVRDIGLMSATLALMLNVLPYPFVWPRSIKEWLELISK